MAQLVAFDCDPYTQFRLAGALTDIHCLYESATRFNFARRRIGYPIPSFTGTNTIPEYIYLIHILFVYHILFMTPISILFVSILEIFRHHPCYGQC